MVFIKGRQVIMMPIVNADKGDHSWVEFLKFFTVTDRDQHIPGAMNDIGMAFYFLNPFICAKMIAQYKPDRKNGQKSFDGFYKTIIRRIQYQVPWIIISCKFGSEAATKASAINNKMSFAILFFQILVNKLHIVHHFLFTSFTGTFSKAAVIHQYYIIIKPVKITGILGPTLYTPGISMEIKDQPFCIFPVKMKTVDPDTGFHIKKIFFEWCVIFELKILL